MTARMIKTLYLYFKDTNNIECNTFNSIHINASIHLIGSYPSFKLLMQIHGFIGNSNKTAEGRPTVITH